jgi:pimeloyl-ACP methyl ester carboxylesterase
MRVGERININTFDGTKESMRGLMELIINRRDLISDDLLEMRTSAANRQRESYQAFFTTNLNDYGLAQKFSLKHRWPRVKVPGIYLYGAQDVLSPVENGFHQEDACPNIQFFYPDPCGHQGQTDQPEIFNQVFLEFFRDGRVSRATADAAGVSKRRPELPQFVEQEDVAAAPQETVGTS